MTPWISILKISSHSPSALASTFFNTRCINFLRRRIVRDTRDHTSSKVCLFPDAMACSTSCRASTRADGCAAELEPRFRFGSAGSICRIICVIIFSLNIPNSLNLCICVYLIWSLVISV